MHIISSITLAFCTTYTQAFLNRIFAGFCAGSIPVTKSLIREMTTDKNISEVYKYFAIGVGVANVVGPLFSMASTQSLSFVFGDFGFLKDYPYCFPLFFQYFLFSSLLGFFTLLIAGFYLVEDERSIERGDELKFSLLNNRQYLLTVLVFCILAFTQVGFRLVFSLICSSSETIGGMGIKYEYQVSLIQLSGGIIISFLSPILTKELHSKFGLKTSLLYLLLAISTASASLGICALLPEYLKYIGLILVYIIGNTSIIVSTLYISICISNSITEDLLSTANGFSEAIIAVSRFSGNSCIGVLFGWSASVGLRIPGIDVKFACFILSGILVVNLILIKFRVDSSVEKKKQNKELSIELIEKRKI